MNQTRKWIPKRGQWITWKGSRRRTIARVLEDIDGDGEIGVSFEPDDKSTSFIAVDERMEPWRPHPGEQFLYADEFKIIATSDAPRNDPQSHVRGYGADDGEKVLGDYELSECRPLWPLVTVSLLPSAFATKAELLGFLDAALDDHGNARPDADLGRLGAAMEWMRTQLDRSERKEGP